MQEFLNSGVIFSPYDERDYQYLPSVGSPEILPVTYKTDTSMFPVWMQHNEPSCVSHSIARLMQIYWYKKTGKIINFSPRFLHAYTAPGMATTDGRDPRIIAKTACNIGCCTEELLPNDTTLDNATYMNVPITQAMLDEAAQYKMPPFYMVPIDSYSIRHAIYHKGGVALCFKVGKEMWTAPNGQTSWNPADINPLRAPQVVVSGHEMVGEHWNGTLDGIENSWSTGWNEGGYGEYNLTNYQPTQAIMFDDGILDWNPIDDPAVVQELTQEVTLYSIIVSLLQRLNFLKKI
jgi:hypothetical protein